MTIGRKLGLLCLAFALPVVTLLGFFVGDRQQISATAEAELESARSLEPLRLLSRELTLTRVLVVATTEQGATRSSQVAEAEKRIQKHFRALIATTDGSRAAELQRMSRRWDSLAAQPLQPVFTDSSYRALLNQLAVYTQEMGLSSPVVQDQEPAPFWLGQALVRTLPELDALRATLVDTASVAAQRGEVLPHERVELEALSTQLDTLLNDTADVFQRSGEEGSFGVTVQSVLSAHQVILDDVKFRLTDVRSPRLAVTDFRMHHIQADTASLALWQLSSRTFQKHLRARITKLDRDTTTAIVSTLGAISVTMFLATLLIRSIRRPLRSAAAIARRMSEGDITAELPVDRPDEIGVMLHAMRDVLHDLHERAFLDPLTGLPNRRAFAARVQESLDARQRQQGVALLFVDLDHFKQINDVMGHASGDALLTALAERLRSSSRPSDTVARFGGDEFTILMDNLDSVEQAVRAAQRISDALREPFELCGRELFITASIGIGYSTDPATMPGDLLREADVALYRSKSDGRDRHTIFVEAMTEGAIEQLQLESDLRRAIDGGELRLAFQPILDTSSGTMVGAEALVRWERPGHGTMLPNGFIPVAEANGLIQPLGLWVLRESCVWAAEHNRSHTGTPLFVSVNLSSRQIRRQQELSDIIALTLVETGLPPSQLRLEITETAVMQDEQGALEFLTSMGNLGVQLLIDDFGTGYSTLRALQELPVHGIKIDMSFVQGVERDLTKQVLVRSIIDMAKALHIIVVAEGVEETAQHEFLRNAGCHFVQGFLYSRPMAAERFEAWTESRVDIQASSPKIGRQRRFSE